MEQLLTQFLEHLRYERNVSEHTLRNYAIDLGQFLEHLAPADPRTGERRAPDVKEIDHITIREWLSELHDAQKKKSSIARKLAALRTFFQFLIREGAVELNPAKLVSTPRLEKKLPNHLSVEDAVRFIETPDTNTDLGKRDRAILEMLYGTGVRVSELVKLGLRDVDFKNRMVRVKGKRRKERVVPFGEPALVALGRGGAVEEVVAHEQV
ncbi:MAG TPA: site-specific integrase, partial [Pyrinomonadaceae bacterium]